MEALVFFVLTPLTAGILQFFLSRSRLPRRAKWGPAVLVMSMGMVCFLGTVDCLPLPNTYWLDDWLDDGSFLFFPDYFYGMLFSLPALFGLGVGALFSVAQWPD